MRLFSIILMIAGILITFVGTTAKMMHWPYMNVILVAGLILVGIGGLIRKFLNTER
jgi:hypothetical protein